ncbi:hypothetical protein D0868_01033 [Hortaea werneckii]|nr:hypothetical protein D0868_01033 [Hortaea werneckii]
MKTFTTAAISVAFLASNVHAFPTMAMDALTEPLKADAFNVKRTAEIHARQGAAPPQGAGALPAVPPPFDAKAQYVSNQGKYKFVPPGPGDARGECPGLNALANHNYLPHNGYATIQQFIDATNTGFGMAKDLGGFLALYGALVDGNLLGWSINGGPHIGIGGSHNNYEADSSPLKSDLNQYGSNQKLIKDQFYSLYNRQPDAATANYNLEVLRDFRKERYYESIQKNPYYSYLPFTGIEVSQAAFTFIYRFMSNKSAENPEGVLNKDVLKSFMAIYGDDEENLHWKRGYERFPDNFYKRNPTDEYSIPYCKSPSQKAEEARKIILTFLPVEADILYFAETVPEVLELGCNHGAVNTFNTIDAATLSNGAYTAEQAAKSPLCFASAFAKVEIPLITGLSNSALKPLFDTLNTLTGNMNCASIGSVNQSALTACPGFSFYGGPTGPVAKGAIQDPVLN